MSTDKQNTHKKPTLAYAIVTLVCLTAFLVISFTFLGFPILAAIFFSWLLTGVFALALGYSADEIEGAVTDMIKIGVGLFALLLAVGCMIAILLSCGTIPTMIYAGLKIITPKIFLPLAFLLCCTIGLVTGTSWGTTATIGVAMMGIGQGLGIPVPMVAGAVVSGCSFGTGCSPVSDNPLLASALCEVDVLKHCKHLFKVSGPAVGIATVIFFIMGLISANSALDAGAISVITDTIAANFKVGIIPFIPMIIICALLIMRKPATTALMIGSFVGIFIAVFYQGHPISSVANFLVSGFKISTGNATLDPIFNRGGMSSMLELVATIIAALGLGGILKSCGFIDTLMEALSKCIKGRIGLTNASIAINVATIAMVPAEYFGALLSITLLAPLYKFYGYAPEECSRINGVLGQMVNDLIPWGLSAIFIGSTLGVSSTQYAPYALYHWCMLAVFLVYGYTGFNMKKEAADPA